ncbi:SET domain-containing protein 4 [Hetaerina americana]|uniref:SET domain-containing protein 4 n=1 Tax=Hetaerina americana TaxID=62018 RepID=UPI003A7F3087
MNGLRFHRKGRTSRRRSKRTSTANLDNLSCDPSVIVLVQWMCSQGWKATSKLRLANSLVTGRGLQAVKGIKTGDILISIPEKLLITPNTACNRLRVDNLNVPLSEHSLLCVFILLEVHYGNYSPWFPYFQTLPKTFTVPSYCSDSEIGLLPPFMRNRVIDQKRALESAFTNVCEFIKIQISNEKMCSSLPIPTLSQYKFAWFVVNTRAVYMSSGTNKSGCKILKPGSSSNLALAPFLDMFNHSFDAGVEAGYNHSSRSYEIRSLTRYSPKSQVFINYGPHDNMKLWIEYGFYLTNNPHDVVTFEYNDIIATAKRSPQTSVITSQKLEFLRTHGLLGNLTCSIEGLSWNLSALICIISLKDSDKSSYYRVFRGDWLPFDTTFERQLALEIVTCKKLELRQAQKNMQSLQNCSSSFKIANGILEEYVRILDRTEAKYKDLCQEVN